MKASTAILIFYSPWAYPPPPWSPGQIISYIILSSLCVFATVRQTRQQITEGDNLTSPHGISGRTPYAFQRCTSQREIGKGQSQASASQASPIPSHSSGSGPL